MKSGRRSSATFFAVQGRAASGSMAPTAAGGMRRWALLLIALGPLCVSSMTLRSSRRGAIGVSPMAKVLEMLQQMLTKSTKLDQEAATQYAMVEQTCTSSIASTDAEIASYTSSVATLEAAVLQLEADIQQSSASVQGHHTDIERYDQDWAIAKEQYAKAVANYEQDIATYDKAINAAERAQLIVKTQVPDARSASLAQVRAALAHAVRIASPAAFLAHKASPDDGMARDAHIFDEFDNVAAGSTSYSTEMSSLEATIASVLQQFRTYKADLLQSKQTAKANLDRTLPRLERQMTVSKSSLDAASRYLASKKTMVVSKRQELADQKELLDSTTAYKTKLEAACSEKETSYKEMSALRKNEISALSKSISLLSAQTSGTTTGIKLLRLRVAPSSVDTAGGEEKVLGFLRLQARKLESGSLDRLAGQLEALVEQQSLAGDGAAADPARDDALSKVKTMIQDLITRLQSEAAAEATHHAWCTAELAKNEQARTSAQEDIDTHTAKASQLSAAIDKLSMELAELNTTLAKSKIDRAELVQQRNVSSTENALAISDADSSVAALDAAMLLIKEYYANASRAFLQTPPQSAGKASHNATASGAKLSLAHGRAQVRQLPAEVTQDAVAGPLVDESQGVLAMLEVVRDDYKSISTKTAKEESDAAQKHVEAIRDIDVKIASAQKDVTYKTDLQVQYQTDLASAAAGLNASTQALSDATTLHDQLKSPCLDGETPAERAAKRQAEIDALQEAYNMLVQMSKDMGYTTLLQAPAASASQASAPATPAASAQPRSVVAQVPAALVPVPAVPLRDGAAAVVALAAASVATTQGRNASSPAEDVAKLLQQIKAEVETELANDTAVYKENKQWCDSSIAASEAAVQLANDRDQQLMTQVETSTQTKAQLEVQIERLKSELAKEQQSLEQSTAIRENDAEKFRDNEKELLESISSLKHALVVLDSRYNKTDSRNYTAEQEKLAQEKLALSGNATALVKVAGEVQRALSSLPAEDAAALASSSSGAVLQDFLAKPSEFGGLSTLSLGAEVTAGPSASGQQIFGILQQLLVTFQEDLKAAQDRESSGNETYVNLRDTKKTQIDALSQSLILKEQQLAQGSVTNAQAKEDLASVRASREAEVKYLMSLQAQCRDIEYEFQARNRTRHEEVASLSEAIAILEAGSSAPTATAAPTVKLHAVAPKAVQPSAAAPLPAALHVLAAVAPTAKPRPESIVDAFIKSHRSLEAPRSAVPSPGSLARALTLALRVPPPLVALNAAAATPQLRKLSALALRSRQTPAPNVDSAFAPIAAALDKVRTTLIAEKAREVEFQQLCIKEKHDTETQLAREQHSETALNATAQRLDAVISNSGAKITELEDQIKQMNSSMTVAQAERSAQHASFKDAIVAQEALQGKLRQAIQSLKAFYGQTAFLQNGTAATPVNTTRTAKPSGFTRPMQKHGATKGVIAILDLLIHDSETLVESIVEAEQKARDAYAVNVANTRSVIQDNEHQIILLRSQSTNAGVELGTTQVEQKDAEVEIQEIQLYLQTIAQKCDYIIANFTQSQAARQAQIDNIAQAKEVFMGVLAQP